MDIRKFFQKKHAPDSTPSPCAKEHKETKELSPEARDPSAVPPASSYNTSTQSAQLSDQGEPSSSTINTMPVVTVHRSTVETRVATDSTRVYLIVAIMKKLSNFIKLLQLLIDIICVVLISSSLGNIYNDDRRSYVLTSLLFCVHAMITTFCLVFCMLLRGFTVDLSSKVSFESVYHFLTGVLLVIAGILLLTVNTQTHKGLHDAAILMIFNSSLYFISFLIAISLFRVA